MKLSAKNIEILLNTNIILNRSEWTNNYRHKISSIVDKKNKISFVSNAVIILQKESTVLFQVATINPSLNYAFSLNASKTIFSRFALFAKAVTIITEITKE